MQFLVYVLKRIIIYWHAIGLDSVSAARVADILHAIAHDPVNPTPIIASIHQPRFVSLFLGDNCLLVIRTVRNCIRSLTLSFFSHMAVPFIPDLAASLLRNTFPMLEPLLHMKKDIMSLNIYWKLPMILQPAYSSYANLIPQKKATMLEVHLGKIFLLHQLREVILWGIGMPRPS